MPNESELSYTDIRLLRGERTRAVFAAELGVDPHTIYRWELPPSSAQARRPRGAVLARLRALASRPAAPPPVADPPAATLTAVAGGDESTLPVSAALQRVLDGDWRDAEAVFLRALGQRSASPATGVLAATGLAVIELLYRADSRRALAAISAGPAGAPPLALAEAVTALAYSFPDGELFDVGRVHDHATRAEQLGRGESPVATAMAIAAEANAALMCGDDDLLIRALPRIDELALGAMPDVPAMFVEQLRALAAAKQGHIRLSTERLDRLLANPRLSVAPPIEARVCAMRALRSLDELGEPNEALAMARRARAIVEAARLPAGVHTGIALRAEAEALMRLGRLADAGLVFAEADRVLAEQRFPVTIVLPAQIRYFLITGQADALQAQADRLAAIELPSLRGVTQAYAAWFAATAALSRADAMPGVLRAFAHAERLADRWATLRRDVLMSYANAALGAGEAVEARQVFVRAQRAADRSRTAWTSAQLRRIEGNLLAIEGRLAEGQVAFEAAAATFEASGDLLDATLARFGGARMHEAIGQPGAAETAAAHQAELAAMGVPRPAWILRCVDTVARVLAGRTPRPTEQVTAMAPGIEVAVERLAVTGATPMMIVRELALVARELLGAEVIVADEQATGTHDMAAWFELGSSGHRLGIAAPPSDRDRATLRVLALVAGLALDAAQLRGGDATTTQAGDLPDVPGLVAVSPAMRRVLADVGRLAGSHATVVITGESGVGKELIARALHQLSPRAAKPYVAFNCAAVPHELFEGQLFGYRKGAFTGATADHAGVVRAADGGTLFLDEIGELPLDIQPKLLRWLDNAEVFPLGAERPATVNVRLIAATNRDLAAEVKRGRFREDLYYRLMVVPLSVPPLRTRKEDVVPLARFFARGLADGRAPAFAPDALAALAAHGWPGNVRELRNVIARAFAFSPRPDVITRAQLGL
jgi:tetratricopeptide (TPR) repeat protein